MTVEVEGPASRACVRVVDTGIGMSAEMLSRLFEPFAQADTSLDRSKGGLRLGLALAKGLVELHGGEMSASSEGLGRGSEFVVRLPPEGTDAPRPAATPATSKAVSRRELIGEDNLDAGRACGESSCWPDEVKVTYDGREGIAKAAHVKPDSVLQRRCRGWTATRCPGRRP